MKNRARIIEDLDVGVVFTEEQLKKHKEKKKELEEKKQKQEEEEEPE